MRDLVAERDGPGGPVRYVDVARAGLRGTATAPRTAVLLAENILRTAEPAGRDEALAQAQQVLDPPAAAAGPGAGLRIRPSRLLLQDHSGIPVLADVASARRTAAELGIPAAALDLTLPVDLVVDHSVEVQASRRPGALAANMAYEFAHNAERFRFLKWAAGAFAGLRIVPPGRGIVHQIHLEALARVVGPDPRRPDLLGYDFVLGTDSHTPMVNGLGVLGWGVGGVEAVGVALGGAVWLPVPEIVGVRLRGALRPPATATDLALTVTRELRAAGVVGALLEFTGPGVGTLSVPDRATVANMAPEYGSTAALFPVDDRTLDYLRLTGRDPGQVALVEAYHRWQGTFGAREDAAFARVVEIDLAAVEPVLAGPTRPEQTVPLSRVPASVPRRGRRPGGHVVLAAITSCTNTANSRSMVTAGLVAAKAVERGLRPPEWVKTSMTPGSPAVTAHLDAAGLLPALEKLGFHVAGYGCGTCIGNSGPLLPAAAERPGRPRVAVLSGNRNFEGRIHAEVDAAYLASPPLVVAYALAGEVTRDLTAGPLQAGSTVRLADLWPTEAEVDAALAHLTPELYAGQRRQLLRGDEAWEGAGRAGRAAVRLAGRVDVRAADAVLAAGLRPDRAAARGPGAGPGAGPDHHRPHLPRRGDRAGLGGRPLPARPRRAAGRLRQLRHPAGQPRRAAARGLRQPAVPQRAGRPARPVHHPPALRRGAGAGGRGRAVPGRGGAAGHPGRPRLRGGQLPGLGRQGPGAARRAGRAGPRLRADPPQQPGRGRHPAAAVPSTARGRTSSAWTAPSGTTSSCRRPRWRAARPGCGPSGPTAPSWPGSCGSAWTPRPRPRSGGPAGRCPRRSPPSVPAQRGRHPHDEHPHRARHRPVGVAAGGRRGPGRLDVRADRGDAGRGDPGRGDSWPPRAPSAPRPARTSTCRWSARWSSSWSTSWSTAAGWCCSRACRSRG